MTISVKHAFTSAKADGTDSTLIQPTNWNAEHTITAAAGKILGRASGTAGAIQELSLAFDSTGQSMIPPSGDTASRPTGASGMFRYNTTDNLFEYYNGTTWNSIGSALTAIVTGGTAASSTLTLQSTSGVGTTDSIALKVGNNGATTAMTANTSGNIEFRAGTVALPALTTTGDTNTGIFFPAADTIAFTEGGAEAMRINSSGQVEFTAGTAALPAISTTGDINTGVFYPAADTVGVVTGGTEKVRVASAGQIGIGGANYGTSGQVLTSGGAAAAPSWATVSASGRLLQAPQILITGTSYTTPAGCTSIYVELVGGGGGGGGSDNTSNNTDVAAGAGGGGGGYGASYIPVSASTAYAIAIGAGGTGGSTTGGNGGTGGTTSIIVGVTTYSASGGTGGEGAVGPSTSSTNDNEVSTGGLGGSGGSATNTTLDLDGGCGQNSSVVIVRSIAATASNVTSVTHSMVSGGGGSSYFGGGARGQITVGTAGSAAPQGGGGGSGSIVTSNTGLAGGAGGAGIIRIWEYS